MIDQDREQIDKIVYLASLGSAKDVIDAKMDTLRVVTARWQPGTELDQARRTQLRNLEDELRQYLVRQDPLRNFTLESLEQRLQTSARSDSGEKPLTFLLLVLLSFLAPLLVFIIPPYTTWSFADRMLWAVPVYFSAISAEIVWVYRSALHNFKPELRRVITFQYSAAIALALAFFVYVLLQLFHWYRLPFFQYGGLPYAGGVSLLLLYVSMRQYGALLKSSGRFTSTPMLLGVLATVSCIGAFVPLATAVDHELYFRISITGMLVLATFATFGAGIASTILHAVTPAYARSLRIIYWFLLAVSICGPLFAAFLYIAGALEASKLGYVMIPLAGPPMLLLLYSAYSFKKETSR
jgi:hypothetical protein